jgi:hypothetical protein
MSADNSAEGKYAAGELQWAPDGSSVVLLDKGQAQMCVLYETVNEVSRRWDGEEGLTEVMEEDEPEEG